jgi:hypothetical protein
MSEWKYNKNQTGRQKNYDGITNRIFLMVCRSNKGQIFKGVDPHCFLKTVCVHNGKFTSALNIKIVHTANKYCVVSQGLRCCRTVFALGRRESPLDLPGMRIYEQAQVIQASLQKCLDKKGGHSAQLFTCYDHYHVPRTNNDLERFFRELL